MLEEVYRYTGSILASGQQDIHTECPIWLRNQIEVRAKLTDNASGTAPTLNVRLQCRGPENVWTDRLALAQFGSDSSGEDHIGVVNEWVTLGATEYSYEPSGSSGSRLSAGGVINGPFPPPYWASVTRSLYTDIVPGHQWRLDFVVTGSATPTFPIVIIVSCNPVDDN